MHVLTHTLTLYVCLSMLPKLCCNNSRSKSTSRYCGFAAVLAFLLCTATSLQRTVRGWLSLSAAVWA